MSVQLVLGHLQFFRSVSCTGVSFQIFLRGGQRRLGERNELTQQGEFGGGGGGGGLLQAPIKKLFFYFELFYVLFEAT